MQTMYPAFVNSPETVTLGAISPTATTVTVQDITKIPEPPNLLVIGGDRPDAETVLLTAVSGSTLTIQRAVNGSARTWADRTTIARNFTAYDHDAFKANIEALNTEKLDTGGDGSNVTAAFSQATTKANIATGEKLSVIFGKLMKWYASFGAAAWMGTGTTASTVALGNHTHTAAAVGAVPTTRKVNGKVLSEDVTLAAPDVGARAEDWLPTLAQVGGYRGKLLDNGDFRNPINQRGFTEETESSKYTLDRWKTELSLPGAGSIIYDNTNKCLIIRRTGGDKTILVRQNFEVPLLENVAVTITIKLQDDSIYSVTVTPTNTSQTRDLDTSKSLRVYISRQSFAIVNYSATIANADIAIQWVKMEYGTSSTPFYPETNPEQELAKCQRFYENSWYPNAKTVPNEMFAHCFSTGNADLRIEFKTTKRVIPSMNYYSNDTNPTWRVYNGGYYQVANVENTTRGGCAASVTRLTKSAEDPSTWTTGSTIQVHGRWEAIADL